MPLSFLLLSVPATFATDLHNENRPDMDEVFERVSLWQTVTAT